MFQAVAVLIKVIAFVLVISLFVQSFVSELIKFRFFPSRFRTKSVLYIKIHKIYYLKFFHFEQIHLIIFRLFNQKTHWQRPFFKNEFIRVVTLLIHLSSESFKLFLSDSADVAEPLAIWLNPRRLCRLFVHGLHIRLIIVHIQEFYFRF